VREQMSGVGIPTLVPNAQPLQAMLEVTRYGSKTVRTNGNGSGDGAPADGSGHTPRDSTNTGKGLR
jgi:hypothetical protein